MLLKEAVVKGGCDGPAKGQCYSEGDALVM